MIQPLLPIAAGVAATVPAAALGWAMARIAEPLVRTPQPRGALWSAALGLIALTGIGTAFWGAPPPPVLQARTIAVQSLPRIAEPFIAPPVWRIDLMPWVEGLLAVLLAGAAFNLILLGVRMAQARRLILKAHAFSEPDLQADLQVRARRLGVAAPPLLVSETAKTAMLAGTVRPVIVLPAALVQQTAPTALALICAHEMAHLKRRDNWRALADRLVLALLWFNPFAVDIVRRQVAVREELCDQMVLSGAHPAERRLYAATLVEALRLAGPQALHPSFIRRKGAGHAMRLKAILQPVAKPRRAALLAAGGLALAAVAASLSTGAALAQAADKAASAAGSTEGSAPTASGAISYLVSIKLYDGEKLVASPRLTVAEGQPARVEIGSDEGASYKVFVTTKQIDKERDAIEAHATITKTGVRSEIAWPRMIMKRGGSAALKIAGKISMTISPLNNPGGALGAERRLDASAANKPGSAVGISANKVKYKDATASDMQRYCASGEARDDGWCAGVIFASLPTTGGSNGPSCLPNGMSVQDAQRRGRAAILTTPSTPGESAGAFAQSVLARTFTCRNVVDRSRSDTGGVTITSDKSTVTSTSIYEGSPTIHIDGRAGSAISLNGQFVPDDFDVSTIKPETIARIEATSNPKARPGQPRSFINIVTKTP